MIETKEWAAPYTDQMHYIIDAMNSVRNLPNSREKSLIYTKLEEAYLRLKELENMWPKC